MSRTDPAGPPLLSIVIPAFNEEDSIVRGVLQELADYLATQDFTCEVLVVDDGSDDATIELVQRFAAENPSFRLLQEPHRGKADAVRAGILAAAGRYHMFMDMDLATSVEHISEFVRELQRGADVVIASRAKKGAVTVGAPASRFLLGKGFNFLVHAFLLPGIQDTQCGFKAFRAEAARGLFNSLLVFDDTTGTTKGPRVTAFDVELLVLAARWGYSIHEMPVRWQYYKTRRVSPLKDAYRMFSEVLRVWLNDRRGKYRPAATPVTHSDRMV
jgi:glycosyltransferase involved in cell wall biosynthesis